MKKIKISVLLLSGAILLGSCSTMNNTAKGGVIGGGSGAAAGAIIGGLIGKESSGERYSRTYRRCGIYSGYTDQP